MVKNTSSSRLILTMIISVILVSQILSQRLTLNLKNPKAHYFQDEEEFADFGKFFGQFLKFLHILLVILLILDAVMRYAGKMIEKRGFTNFYRSAMFLQVIGMMSLPNLPTLFLNKGYIQESAALRGFMTYLTWGALKGVNAGWFGFSDEMFEESQYEDKYHHTIVFWEGLIPELVIYVILLVLSSFICCGGSLSSSSSWMVNLSNLFAVLRKYWILSFGFTFLIRSILVIKWYFEMEDREWDQFMYTNIGSTAIVVLATLVEYIELLWESIGQTSVASAASSFFSSKTSSNQIQYKLVVRNTKNAYIDFSKSDSDCSTRCYNFYWIWRWVVIIPVYSSLFTPLDSDKLYMEMAVTVIQIAWFIYTVLVSMCHKIFHNKLVGYFLCLQEFMIVIIHLGALVFYYDDKNNNDDLSEEMVTGMSMTIIGCWFGAIICQVLVFVLGILTSMEVKSGPYIK